MKHSTHMVLTLVSCGLWAPVWLVVVMVQAVTRPTRAAVRAVTPSAPVEWRYDETKGWLRND